MTDHNTMNTTVFCCDETPEGIFTAIYDAWSSRLGHSHVRIAFTDQEEPTLFCDYRTVDTDISKAEKVIGSVQRKISVRARQLVYRAALAPDASRADDIYRFLIGGFYYGAPVTSMLAEPAVQRIQDLNRFVGNEAHYYREFLRFDSLNDQVLLARIRPKSHVLPLLAPDFADRIPDENFCILDVGRKIAALHPAQTGPSGSAADLSAWYLRTLTGEEFDRLNTPRRDEYSDLWKTFFRSVAIEARRNPECQRNRMALRYREFAPEFETDPEYPV